MSYLHDLGIVCSLGNCKEQVFDSLINRPSKEYLTPWRQALDSDKVFQCGQVKLNANEMPDLTKYPLHFQSRNNQLSLLAYQQIEKTVNQINADICPSRVAVVLGTSTSGIKEGEIARAAHKGLGIWPENYHYSIQEMASPAHFIAEIVGAKGPVYTISTACSSSSKALASARNLLNSNLVDMVICGGVDTLSHLPNNGFNSLESIANQFCNPLSAERDGINIGEGAALFVMSKKPANIKLKGVGETSDAYHISAPHPEGEGAKAAMELALNNAGLTVDDIHYINLHGTATIKNDEMETHAVAEIFGAKVPCSSTKRFTGHTLGAAGGIEAGILWLLLSSLNIEDNIPINKSDFGIDANFDKIAISQGSLGVSLENALSNSFAFGGNNISIILGKENEKLRD
ncbi:beta-ketoacyl-ACP synthase [Thalassotalea sp. 1_MG-2023]|uniref:beta-ketoacyl-ACP synthase n=1 Tax=Thalassotalea sp. 1_MG-2023 TaxID=3062680 RepID=UPI0026E2512E|nr:beta-ketoacyl-ACP synthase [Thalassotalea sp. 1_MG-2023]MDO6426645.1 beta-ketoacyl-ACP synthase [Thalassotalea sp. 1_MG-2023]